jgi:hypothetical protein
MIAASMIHSNTRAELSYLLPGALFFILRLSCTRSHKKLGGDHLHLISFGWLSLPRLCSFFVAIFFFISFFFGWKWFNLSNREMTAWALPLRPLNVQIDEKMWDIFLWAVTFLSFCSSRFCYINRKSHIAAWAPEAVHSAPTSILLKPILYFFQIYRGNLFVQKDKQGGRKRGKWWQRTS